MHLVGVFSDIHCGSTVGLMGEPVLLDDENFFHPSTLQKWLWQEWVEAWKKMQKLQQEADKFTLISLGDLTENTHHGTHQVISNQPSVHSRVATDALRIPLSMIPDAIHIIRGTSSHTGKGSSHEESIARHLASHGHPVIKDPDTNQYTSYRRRIMIEETLLDCAHHGRAGQRPWTSKSYSQIYGTEIWTSQMQDCYRAMRQNPDDLVNIFNEMRPPDISLRGHHHRYVDSGPAEDFGTRLVRCGCFQAPTEFIYRIAAETTPSIGIVALLIRDTHVEVIPFLSQISRSSIIQEQ
jgi:hypothetical protein